jgi:hypothetical protein
MPLQGLVNNKRLVQGLSWCEMFLKCKLDHYCLVFMLKLILTHFKQTLKISKIRWLSLHILF